MESARPHHCRRGVRVRETPAASYDDLLDQETEIIDDDGAAGLAVGAAVEEQKCPDCGVGELCWAEAGYVPWHRVCDRCGSHWSLAVATPWGPARRVHVTSWGETVAPPDLVRFVSGEGEVPLVPGDLIVDGAPFTWGDALTAATSDDWRAADAACDLTCGLATVPVSVVVRARFYGG